jgi:hypothetical protein
VKPSWKYTRNVLEETDIMHFFVKLQPDQIDDDTKSIMRGLLLEQGANLPELVKNTQLLLARRFYEWFLAFTEGCEPARDAASRAASRPISSAQESENMSPGLLSPAGEEGEGRLGDMPDYAFNSLASPPRESPDPVPAPTQRSSSHRSSRGADSRADSRPDSRALSPDSAIPGAPSSGRSSPRKKKSKKASKKSSRSRTPGADSVLSEDAAAAEGVEGGSRSLSPAKKSKKSKQEKRSKSRNSSRQE